MCKGGLDADYPILYGLRPDTRSWVVRVIAHKCDPFTRQWHPACILEDRRRIKYATNLTLRRHHRETMRRRIMDSNDYNTDERQRLRLRKMAISKVIDPTKTSSVSLYRTIFGRIIFGCRPNEKVDAASQEQRRQTVKDTDHTHLGAVSYR